MKNLKIKEIVELTKGELIKGSLEEVVGSFCKDTRTIKQGEAYIGIKGGKFDGSSLWREAFAKGATTVIVQDINFTNEDLKGFENKNIIKVEDTLKAISDIASYKRSLYGNDFPVIGVTGSVGKTSTKDIIASVVSKRYKTLKTEGNKNNNIGLPFTIFNLNNHQAAVIEMGMDHFGEISALTKIAKPTISVITNIGTSHIGNLGSIENILKAKLEILEGMNKKVLVINNDDVLLHNFYVKNNDNKDLQIHTYGIENKSELMAEDIVLNKNGSEFACILNGEKIKVKVPVGGIHYVYNALCAITVANLLGLNVDEIKSGIESFELTEKRMDITELKNGVTIINDSYNANCESMKASLRYLSGLSSKRKIAVLGDMFGLGDFSKELHEDVGEYVARNNIDILICCGDYAKYIVEAAKKNGMKDDFIFYFDDKIDVVDFIIQFWRYGDSILIKASNAMRFFEMAEMLLNSL